MSGSSANRTLFSVKSRKGLLTSSHRVAGAFASGNKSPIEREAGRLLMLRYKTCSAMGLRDFVMRSSGWRSCGQERNVSIYAVDELQREGH